MGDRLLIGVRLEHLLIKKSSNHQRPLHDLYADQRESCHQELFTGDIIWEKGSVSCNLFDFPEPSPLSSGGNVSVQWKQLLKSKQIFEEEGHT